MSAHINRQYNAHNDGNSNYDSPDYSWGKEVFTSVKYVVHAMQAAVLCVFNCCLLQRILKELIMKILNIGFMLNELSS